MEKTLTLKSLLEIESSLAELSKIKLPVRPSFKISKMLNNIKVELENYNTVRQNLFNELGESVPEKPDQKRIKEENVQEFINQHNELLSTEVKVIYDKISIDELQNIDIPPKVLMDIEFMISE